MNVQLVALTQLTFTDLVYNPIMLFGFVSHYLLKLINVVAGWSMTIQIIICVFKGMDMDMYAFIYTTVIMLTIAIKCS